MVLLFCLLVSHTISLLEGVRYSITNDVVSVGSRLRVTSYGPFREHWGTVRDVHTIAADLEEPFCFYLVALDNGQRKEPIRFEHSEVEIHSFLARCPPATLSARQRIKNMGIFVGYPCFLSSSS